MPEQTPIMESRSDAVQEIIGREPAWIIRWGITVVLVTVVVFLIATWVIKYPETITAKISITTIEPPVKVIARASGKITRFFVSDSEQVEAGSYLALLENTADYEDALELRRQLESFHEFLMEPEKVLDQKWNKDVSLGDMQLAYSNFVKVFSDYQTFIREDFISRKIAAVEAQIQQYRNRNQSLISQKDSMAEELALFENKYRKNEELFQQNLISKEDLDAVKSQLLQKRVAQDSAESSIISNDIQINDLNRTIMESRQQHREQERDQLLVAQSAYKALLFSFTQWEQQYVLVAPIAGRVSFFKFWSDNQYVQAGEEVLTLVPQTQALVGKIFMPQFGSGKIAVGQTANIKFDSFPFKEFGVVKGVVASISPVARENQYLINVDLPNGLMTTYRKELKFNHEMAGSADIITEDLRLMERIFNQLRYVFSSST